MNWHCGTDPFMALRFQKDLLLARFDLLWQIFRRSSELDYTEIDLTDGIIWYTYTNSKTQSITIL
jgi:hypothetical protein